MVMVVGSYTRGRRLRAPIATRTRARANLIRVASAAVLRNSWRRTIGLPGVLRNPGGRISRPLGPASSSRTAPLFRYQRRLARRAGDSRGIPMRRGPAVPILRFRR